MKTLKHLLDRNAAWANTVRKKDADFFYKLSEQQSPEYLWIGCSDSRVPATQIVNLLPGEIFVHRNIANLVVKDDLNCLSVIQYAVEVLKVKHIIVCGHYGCGGVKAALSSESLGLIDNWIGHIENIYCAYEEKLGDLRESEKFDLLCELNVREQVRNVCNLAVVKNSWEKGLELSVHGWIYSINDGMLKDLETCISSPEELHELMI